MPPIDKPDTALFIGKTNRYKQQSKENHSVLNVLSAGSCLEQMSIELSTKEWLLAGVERLRDTTMKKSSPKVQP
jgi:hypothetical protein